MIIQDENVPIFCRTDLQPDGLELLSCCCVVETDRSAQWPEVLFWPHASFGNRRETGQSCLRLVQRICVPIRQIQRFRFRFHQARNRIH
jgi:hypothetical protein